MSTDPRTVPRLLLALVLLVAPGWCLWQALELFHLFGESATAAEELEAARWVTAAVGVGLAASLLGLVLSTGRRAATWGFVTALVLSCALAVVAAPSLQRVLPAPEVERRTGACQEHSGGPTTCPGG